MTHGMRGGRLQAPALTARPAQSSQPSSSRAAASGTLASDAIDPLALMQRVADQALAMIDGADGVLVGVLVDPGTIRYVCAAGYLHDWVGQPLALDGSLSGEAIRAGATLVTDDSELDERVNRSATRTFNVRSSVCVPLGRGEERIGVLNVSSTRAAAFDRHDVYLLSGLADFISAVVGAAADFMSTTTRLLSARESARVAASGRADQPDAQLAGRFVAGVLDPSAAAQVESRERLEQVLRTRDFTLVFQPIFDLASGRALGAEALVRFDGGRGEPPDVWLEHAHGVGLGVELELAIVRAIVEQREQLDDDQLLTLNAGPDVIASGRLPAALGSADRSRIVVELTEHLRIDDYPDLDEPLRRLRETGVRLAVDDAGAGFASLTHILRLAPDFIKLDRQLTNGVDTDQGRRCLASSLGRFAEETGAKMIAEGIETDGELAALQDLGISLGQGFLLARPVAIEQLAMAVAGGVRRIRDVEQKRSKHETAARRRRPAHS
jgi:EAL domain-containing protein (putative c-di-GMP-specific phosphodiesterase class I)